MQHLFVSPIRVSAGKRLYSSLLAQYCIPMSSAILNHFKFGISCSSGVRSISYRQNRMVNDNQTATLLLPLLSFLCVESEPFCQFFSKIMLFLICRINTYSWLPLTNVARVHKITHSQSPTSRSVALQSCPNPNRPD